MSISLLKLVKPRRVLTGENSRTVRPATGRCELHRRAVRRAVRRHYLRLRPSPTAYGRRAIFTGSLRSYFSLRQVACQSAAVGLDFWRFIAGIGIGVES